MEETEDFRIHIREIQLNAEIDTVNAILDHYRPLFRRLCEKNKLFIKRLEELSPSTPQLPEKIKLTDQPILKLKEDLKQKRTNKITNSQTHIQRGQQYATKKRQPRKQPKPDYHPPPSHDQTYQQLPRQKQSRQYNRYTPRRYRPENQDLKETITNTVQTLLTQLLPYFQQPYHSTRTPYYEDYYEHYYY